MKLRYTGAWLGITTSLMIGSFLAPASASSAAAKIYWPSAVLSQYVGITAGQSLTVTGENFAPHSRVTLYQCNVRSLGSPDGIVNSRTCDLENATTGTTNAKGVISKTITVDPNGSVAARSAIRVYIYHFSCPAHCWGWGIGTSSPASATLIASPNETWLSPQVVKVTGFDIPVPARGASKDYVVECNPNVLSGDVIACDTANSSTISVKPNGDATGKLSVVTGAVGDGTCGSGSGNFEVCYLVVGNAHGIITATPIDFYK